MAATASAKGPLSQITHTLITLVLSLWVLLTVVCLCQSLVVTQGVLKLTAPVAPLGDLAQTYNYILFPSISRYTFVIKGSTQTVEVSNKSL